MLFQQFAIVKTVIMHVIFFNFTVNDEEVRQNGKLDMQGRRGTMSSSVVCANVKGDISLLNDMHIFS